MSRMLSGIRVLDLTNVLSGPYCSYQLALLGAEVTKVEMPGTGDLARQFGTDPALSRKGMGTGFLAQNAGKRSITLNLKTERGQDLFRRLVQNADIVLENFRPGVMDRLGLGYEALKVLKPDLIYCAISGFGQEGPLRDNPAYDQIIQGLSGIMSVTGQPDGEPLRVGFPLCDTVAGLTAAMAINAALVQRALRGEGQYIDVSLLESTLSAMGWAVAGFLITGVSPQARGNENVTASPSGTFKTGAGLLNISANTQEQFETLCRLLALPELITDPRFATREARLNHRSELKETLEGSLLQRDAVVWEAILNRAGVPAGRVLRVPEIMAHPQLEARHFTQKLGVHPVTGQPLEVVRAGFRLSGGDPAVHRPPPTLGEDTWDVLGELGLEAAEIDDLYAQGVL